MIFQVRVPDLSQKSKTACSKCVTRSCKVGAPDLVILLMYDYRNNKMMNYQSNVYVLV